MVDFAIRPMASSDYGEVWCLQRAAFVDEARIYGTPFVPSLDDTLVETIERLEASQSWVALDQRRIVGAVSLRIYRRGVPDVERLMVAPDRRGEGLASELLVAAEQNARDAGHASLQLVVGALATNNHAIYDHLGWQDAGAEALEGFPHVIVRTMTKAL